MSEDHKIRDLLKTSLGEAPPAPESELDSIALRLEGKKTTSVSERSRKNFLWPLALAASLMAFALFFALRPTPQPAVANGEITEFVYEALAEPYAEPSHAALYEPWIQLAEPNGNSSF